MQFYFKFLFSLAIFLSLTTVMFGQCNSWIWAEDGDNYRQFQHTVDEYGNMYIPTNVDLTSQIGSFTVTNINTRLLILKYDVSGQLIWTREMGSTFAEIPMMKATQGGKVLLIVKVGTNLEVGGMTYPVQGSSNLARTFFMIQLEASNGTVDWVQEVASISDPTDVTFKNLEFDAMGNIYTGGWYKNSLALATTTLNTPHSSEAFMLQLDANGSLVWERTYPSSPSKLDDFTVAPDGTIGMVGSYSPNQSFDVGGVLLMADSVHFNFVASIDNQGNTLWARSLECAIDMEADIAVNSQKTFYIAGYYDESFSMGGLSVTGNGFVGDQTTYLGKLDRHGTVLALTGTGARARPGTNLNALSIDAFDNVYWSPSIHPGDSSIFFPFNPHPQGYDHFVKYDRLDNPLWATSIPGDWRYIAVGNDNKITVQGKPALAFNPIHAGPSNIGSFPVLREKFHAYYKRDLQEILITSFDGQPTCVGTTSPPCAGLGDGWENEAVNDQLDWSVGDTNTIHSAGTGSGSARLTNQYMYLNAQGTSQGQTAELIRPCIDISRHADPHLTFFYHMYGADMGTLHVDIRANGVWTNDVWVKQGQQQANTTDQWRQGDINLTSFIAAGIVDIRFRGETGNGDLGNMAIDEVYVLDNPNCDLALSVSANTTIQQGCDSATLDVTITGGIPNFQEASLTVIGLDQMAGVDPTVIETTWYDEQGNIISTSTGLSMPPITVAPNVTTTYTVESNNYYCMAQGQVTVTVVPCATAIEEDSRFSSLQVFPNPTENFVNITLDWDNTADAQISIRNIQGQTIRKSSEKIHQGANHFSISLEEHPKGIYLLQINLDDQQVIRRIIVE